MARVIAYPGDSPPMVVEEPASYAGALWYYLPLTPENIREAIASHQKRWPDWEMDPELVTE